MERKHPDGACTCDCCKENIPHGGFMYVLLGFTFCETCVKDAIETAPYWEEVYDD